MRLEILDQAARDLVEGFRFYEDQSAAESSRQEADSRKQVKR